MMYSPLYILVILLAFVEARIIKTEPICLRIHTDTLYEEEMLKNRISVPFQLVLDYATNTLFFSCTTKTTELFNIEYLNLKTDEYGLVTGINAGFATAIDSKSHIVYMGGEDGIYQFDYETKFATNLNKVNLNIWQMFYKDGLYFTTYPNEKAFVYKDQDAVEISELKDKILVLAVKNDGTYVYSNSSGLFSYNKATNKSLTLGGHKVNGFATDLCGNIYFSTPTGIYYIDDQQNSIEEIIRREGVFGVAVERNGNIIYASINSIYRLKPINKEFSDNHLENNIL